MCATYCDVLVWFCDFFCVEDLGGIRGPLTAGFTPGVRYENHLLH
jgi:hypothetical protein